MWQSAYDLNRSDSTHALLLEDLMHSIHVKDEFAPLKVAIVHDGTNAKSLSMEEQRKLIPAKDLLHHPEAGPVFKQRVIEQQAEFLKLLAFHGVTLLYPVKQPEAFCQVFTRDPCFAISDTLFLGGLRDSYRHSEMSGITCVAQQVSKMAALGGGGATIEGGDVIVLKGGREILVGMNQHTNEAGFQNLVAHLAGSSTNVVKVPHRALHLDCCLAPLPDGDALCATDKLTDETQAQLRGHFSALIALDREEAALHLAANLLWLDEKNVVSGRATRQTNELLRSRGYVVHEIDFAPHVCMWGSFRCVTCPIVRG
jgi:N-dimethylarginine dimethylaminohydrolase